MTYYPSGHEVLLFGGYSAEAGQPEANYLGFFNDTWAFADNKWTELIPPSTCTPTTCPSNRAAAMVAYYAPMNAILLFGGYYYGNGYPTLSAALSDTWLFYGGTWHNITATAGTPPSSRSDGSMVWDSLDNYALLFGGVAGDGATLGDTWTFDGAWNNITASLSLAPSDRAGAAIADSPSGYIMLFGGETGGAPIEDSCLNSMSIVDWWFYNGAWSQMAKEPTCTVTPAGLSDPTGTFPPCGRVDPALGWVPKNNRFALYGGIGPINESDCLGNTAYLNDTYFYLNPPGATFNWQNVTTDGAPNVGRAEMGYASDFTDGYFEIFGGVPFPFALGLNETWRFFEFVHARLTGPSSIDTNATNVFRVPFTVVGYGGSGVLNYGFTYALLRNVNPLKDGGSTDCSNLTSPGNVYGLPYDGTWLVPCQPTPQSYNVFRVTLHVWDVNDVTDAATSNWTFTVIPPESANILSEYKTFFYTGFDFSNTFSAYLVVAGQPAVTVSATLGGNPLQISQRAGAPDWWDAKPVDMGTVAPGSMVRVTADWSGWTLNASYQVEMIDTPSWLASFLTFAGAPTVHSAGSGPYGKTYTIFENFSWNVGQAFGFNLPVPMIGGDYSLIPGLSVYFSADSLGNLSLYGTYSLSPPDINFGVASLTLNANLNLTGTFSLTNSGAGVTGLQWDSAKAVVSVNGNVGTSVPLYGFDILGVTVGFVLNINVQPSVALTLLLAPTTESANEIISGLQVMISQLFASATLALSVAVSFGIGVASVSIGGTLSVALVFHLYPSLGVAAGWVNGSVYVSASALCWSDSWTIIGPATIYSWKDPPAGGPSSPVSPLGTDVCTIGCNDTYDNGSGTHWTVNSRYYVTAGYDDHVWNLNLTEGPAISNIYPYTEVSGAAGSKGADLFYTDDNVSLPVTQGLTISGVRLDPTTNGLTALPAPRDPNFLLDGPEATTLSDGSLYVVWAALPEAEAQLASPTDITQLELHGARFSPSSGTWGPVTTWTTWGIAESYRVDGTGSSETLVALIASSFLVGGTSSERLVEFDLASGLEISNASVTGLSEVTGARGALSLAIVESVGGNYSLVNLTTGTAVPLTLSLPSGSHLISASFVTNSASTLVLLYRNPKASEVVLYDLGTAAAVANLSIDQSSSNAEAVYGGGTYYVFASGHAGITGWTETGGAFHNLTEIAETNLTSFGVVQVGSSLLVYSLTTNGNITAPIATLNFAEVGATLPPVPGSSVPSSSTSNSGSTASYLLYLGIVAVVVAVLLAVVFIFTRRRPPAAAPKEWTPPGDAAAPEPATSSPPSPPSG
jgi:hypothetical protein